jgi:hypothetical protein
MSMELSNAVRDERNERRAMDEAVGARAAAVEAGREQVRGAGAS